MSRLNPALVGTAALLLAALSYAGGSVIPEITGTPSPTRTSAIADLNDPKLAEAAIQRLVDQGSRGTETLARLALEADDLSVRGRSIIGLAQARGRLADDTLAELIRDPIPLVRLWAFAGQVARVDTLEQLMPLAQQAPTYAGGPRAVQKKAETLLGGASTPALLAAIQAQPQLNAAIGPLLLEAPIDELADAMSTDTNDMVRRQAASWLAAQAQNKGKNSEVAAAVIAGLRYNAKAETVPWSGGALYIPGIQWSRSDARSVVALLNEWNAYCVRKGLTAEQNQIRNNLQSVGLKRAAGGR